MVQADFLSYLDECVSTSEQCALSLGTSVQNLQPGIADLPRLSHVMRNSHRFVVLPAPTVQAHKNLLSHALAPQIDGLIAKAESSIDAQRAKIARLEERLAILQQSRAAPSHATLAGPSASSAPVEDGAEDGWDNQLEGIDMKALTPAQRRQFIMLKGKRKRLEEERNALGV